MPNPQLEVVILSQNAVGQKHVKNTNLSRVCPTIFNVGQDCINYLKSYNKTACPAWDKMWDKTADHCLVPPTHTPLEWGVGQMTGQIWRIE